jgi:hypothetical protein
LETVVSLWRQLLAPVAHRNCLVRAQGLVKTVLHIDARFDPLQIPQNLGILLLLVRFAFRLGM